MKVFEFTIFLNDLLEEVVIWVEAKTKEDALKELMKRLDSSCIDITDKYIGSIDITVGYPINEEQKEESTNV